MSIFMHCGYNSLGWSESRKSMIRSIEKRSLEIISPKCSQKNCDLRVLIIDNVLQKKASCFVFDCLLRMELHVSRLGNYFQWFHHNSWNTRNNEKAAKLPKVNLDFARCSFYFLGALCNERKFHCVKRLFGLSNQIGGKVELGKQRNYKGPLHMSTVDWPGSRDLASPLNPL